jgi:hypothetical protein
MKSKPNKYKLQISGFDSLAHKNDSDCSNSLTDSKILDRTKLRIIRENEMSIHKSRKSSLNPNYSIFIKESNNFLKPENSSKLLHNISGSDSTIACNKNSYDIQESVQTNSNKLKNLPSDENIRTEYKNDLKSIEEIHLNIIRAISNSKRMISILEGNIIVDSFQTVLNIDETDL